MNRYFAPALIALASATLLTACGPKKPEAQAAVGADLPRVKASMVIDGPSVAAVNVAGVGSFRDEARLSFKVGGVVEKVLVREGEPVKAGQLLARLNQRDVQASMAQAQAGYDKALRDLKRGLQLRKEEVITQVQLDDLSTALDLAKAQLNQAKFASDTASIVASADGVVLRRFAQATEVVGAGQPILLLGSASSGFVMKASLSDSEAVKVSVGNPADVQFDAHPGITWSGKVIELSQAADPITGTYGMQVLIDQKSNPSSRLLSGLSGQVRIKPDNYQVARQYLPLGAVVEGDNQQAWIYLVEPNNQVKRTQVQVAFVTESGLALASNLPANSKVVTTGAAYLRDGQTVELVE